MRTIEEMREFFGGKSIIKCSSAEDMRVAAQALRDNGCEVSQYSCTIQAVLRGQIDVWQNSIYRNVQVYSYDGVEYGICGCTENLRGLDRPILSVNDVVSFFSETDVPFTEQEFDAAFADLLR